MGGGRDEGRAVEVQQVPADTDEGILECLLENKRRMGRKLEVVEITLNRDRQLALVMLTSDEGKSVCVCVWVLCVCWCMCVGGSV